MTMALNPYLPLWEHVPDGEPRVFGNRLYIYGSHDKSGGKRYCEDDYVCWSAPLDDLGNWNYEGISYRKKQSPDNETEEKLMFAPDVVRGIDGRYYLYYGTSAVDYIEVAVSDTPSGPFSYYGRITDQQGNPPEGLAFDPGVLVENEKVYLYYGFSSKAPIPGISMNIQPASYMVELDKDMKTVISKPAVIANGYISAKDTSFEKHPFLEASSIRHYGDLYYFVYSSMQGHELCYATSKAPEGPFVFRGVIISNGDIGISKKQRAYDANNHGGLAEINGQYYIFYHRHTQGTHFSRQGCAEKITILPGGQISQVEMTSCGLNPAPLPAEKKYSFGIVCNLQGPKGACHIPSKPPYDETAPYITQEATTDNETIPYLKNMRTGASCGVKYLSFHGENQVAITVRGDAGRIGVYLDEECKESIAVIDIQTAGSIFRTVKAACSAIRGEHAVYFKVESCQGSLDMKEFSFESPLFL